MQKCSPARFELWMQAWVCKLNLYTTGLFHQCFHYFLSHLHFHCLISFPHAAVSSPTRERPLQGLLFATLGVCFFWVYLWQIVLRPLTMRNNPQGAREELYVGLSRVLRIPN